MDNESQNAIKKAEARGYKRGYQAGRRKQQSEALVARLEREKREKRAFRDRAFLAALPAAFAAQGWVRGEKPINTLEERVRLAWETAKAALKQRPL
ncbi:hypothetical protein [Ralstonia mannitolilytica]|uniref:hypothetical protein n=1 Tax=Ralstonia mannitolilytica TaxID=105219 RepID=UPI0011AF965B|nr:hypothetical protein [Ralstonia mannitolilytica]